MMTKFARAVDPSERVERKLRELDSHVAITRWSGNQFPEIPECCCDQRSRSSSALSIVLSAELFAWMVCASCVTTKN